MNRVSLVFTVHDAKGAANVSELREILERIRPDVIFVELPAAACRDYFNVGTRENLESITIRQYRESHQVELVLVDLPAPDEEFCRGSQYLFERMEETSHEYSRLIDLHSTYVSSYGFAYLNSEHCNKIWSDIYQEMLNTLMRIDNPGLVKLYQLWNKTIAIRDKEMMNNVLEYCREHTFDKAAFLVGAAHRKSIIDISREQSAIDSDRIQWDSFGSVSQKESHRGG